MYKLSRVSADTLECRNKSDYDLARSYLHEGWEQIPMRKVGDETRLICAAGKSNGYPDGFYPDINCTFISDPEWVN